VPGVSVIVYVLYGALTIFIILMWIRFVLDLVAAYARNWRPTGFALVLAEVVFSVTDPPIKFVRRFVKPLRIGGVMIDFSWSIVLLVAILLGNVILGFRN